MPSYDEVRAVHAQVKQQLLAIPGVIAVGIGPKITNCQAVGELAIVVGVDNKRPPGEIPPAELIPESVQGIPIDVTEMGRPKIGVDSYNDKRMFREKDGGLKGGIQISAPTLDGKYAPGTLGCIAKLTVPSGDFIVGLTNAHIGNFDPKQPGSPQEQLETPGTETGQPAEADSDCSGCCSNTIGAVVFAKFNAKLDAAIIKLESGLPWAPEVEDLGGITGTRVLDGSTIDELKALQIVVKKRGRTSRVTRGVLRATNLSGPLYFDSVLAREYEDQFHVFPTVPFMDMSQPGDSGSVYLDKERRVVALNWGHGDQVLDPAHPLTSPKVWSSGWGCPISEVLAQLFLSIPTFTGGGVSTVPASNDADPFGTSARAQRPARRRTAFDDAREQLLSTESGRHYFDMLVRNREEVLRLITGHARVQALWRRHDGAKLGNQAMNSVFVPERPIFAGFEPGAVAKAIAELTTALERYGSPRLKEDIQVLRPSLERWQAISLTGLLQDLGAEAREAPAVRVELHDG
jgi:hypothetical protein